MPAYEHSIELSAEPRVAFELIHDYQRRLKWDPLLKDARLLNGATEAAVGVRSLCVGRDHLMAAAVEAEYITFNPPHVAAVKMTRGPWFFDKFAATIRHQSLGPNQSRVTYRYSLEVRPRFLRWVLNPLLCAIFSWETRRRLEALTRAVTMPPFCADTTADNKRSLVSL